MPHTEAFSAESNQLQWLSHAQGFETQTSQGLPKDSNGKTDMQILSVIFRERQFPAVL